MKRYFSMAMTISFLLTILTICVPRPTCADSDILLGITWTDSLLVSFDPYTGTITEVHAQLNPHHSFRGLAYDSNHNMLYALSQVDNNLYSIDPITLEVQHIGNLHVYCHVNSAGLTYNPSSNIFYTILWSESEGVWSDLAVVSI